MNPTSPQGEQGKAGKPDSTLAMARKQIAALGLRLTRDEVGGFWVSGDTSDRLGFQAYARDLDDAVSLAGYLHREGFPS